MNHEDLLKKYGLETLRGADLSKANLPNARLMHVDFSQSNLTCANLRYADLWLSNFSGANLKWADLQGAKLREVAFQGADLFSADFKNAILQEANFYKANLKEADFRWADLRWVNFSEANLQGADLEGSHLWGTNFHKADLLDAAYSISDFLFSINWNKLSDELTLECMRHDAQIIGIAKMNEWAQGGEYPYTLAPRNLKFRQNVKLWDQTDTIPNLSLKQLFIALCKEKNIKI